MKQKFVRFLQNISGYYADTKKKSCRPLKKRKFYADFVTKSKEKSIFLNGSTTKKKKINYRTYI